MKLTELARKHNVSYMSLYNSRAGGGYMYKAIALREKLGDYGKDINPSDIELANFHNKTRQAIWRSKKDGGYAYEMYLLKYRQHKKMLEERKGD